MDDERGQLNALLRRSAELEDQLAGFLGLETLDGTPREVTSRTICGIAFEHAESAKILTVSGNFTSAVGLLRLQYEALVRAFWVMYAASDAAVEKLSCELTTESAQRANNSLFMASEMLEKLDGKAPPEAVSMLVEFKEYSGKPLNSFVHGGLHAIHRHGKGYPVPLLDQLIRASNGLSVMAGMLLVILHGGRAMAGRLPQLQREFSDCLPPPRPTLP